MNPMLIGALVGGGAGLLKSELGRKSKADQMRTEAVKAQYSPWTGIAPRDIQGTDTLDDTMSGAMQGASFGQGMQNSMNQEKIQSAYLKLLQSKMDAEEDDEDPTTVPNSYGSVAGPVNTAQGPYGAALVRY